VRSGPRGFQPIRSARCDCQCAGARPGRATARSSRWLSLRAAPEQGCGGEAGEEMWRSSAEHTRNPTSYYRTRTQAQPALALALEPRTQAYDAHTDSRQGLLQLEVFECRFAKCEPPLRPSAALLTITVTCWVRAVCSQNPSCSFRPTLSSLSGTRTSRACGRSCAPAGSRSYRARRTRAA